jgi:hypothetical protein
MKPPTPLQLYGALSIWMVVAPERFGHQPLSEKEMLAAADRASKELRRMFHKKPLKPWAAREGKEGVEIYPVHRRGKYCEDSAALDSRMTI